MPKIKYIDVIYYSYRMRKLCPNNKNKGVIPKTPNSFPTFHITFPIGTHAWSQLLFTWNVVWSIICILSNFHFPFLTNILPFILLHSFADIMLCRAINISNVYFLCGWSRAACEDTIMQDEYNWKKT